MPTKMSSQFGRSCKRLKISKSKSLEQVDWILLELETELQIATAENGRFEKTACGFSSGGDKQ